MQRMILGCFLLAALNCVAKVDPADQQVLSDSMALVDITSPGSPSFKMEADFVVQSAPIRKGHITWKWANPNLWWREITTENFRQTTLLTSDSIYEAHQGDLSILSASLPMFLTPFHGSHEAPSEPWNATNLKERSKNGITARCFQAERASRRGKAEFCIDPVTKHLLVEVFNVDLPGDSAVYDAYLPFGARAFPRRIGGFDSGKLLVDLTIGSLQAAYFDDSAFAPPAGATVRRHCPNMREPVATSAPDPEYPRSLLPKHISGNVVASVTVLPNGSVGKVEVLTRAPQPEMTQAAEQALHRWKFKPAMCGNEPVETTVNVEISFKLFGP